MREANTWRRVVFDFLQYADVELMDGSRGFGVALDAHAHTVTLTDPNNKSWKAHFSYKSPAYDRLVLDGAIDGHHATLHLQRVDEKKFLLATRGFHWIQDYPFNR